MNQAIAERPVTTDIAKIVYVLFLLTPLTGGITGIIGLVMAYIYRDDAPEWLKTHYELQVRTFWVGLLYAIVATALCFIIIGFALWVALLVWWIVRCVKGLKLLTERASYPNYEAWGF